jgi:hypothetical protein
MAYVNVSLNLKMYKSVLETAFFFTAVKVLIELYIN